MAIWAWPPSFFVAFTAVLRFRISFQAVENTDDIDAVCDGLLYEVLDDIISVGLVAEKILIRGKASAASYS